MKRILAVSFALALAACNSGANVLDDGSMMSEGSSTSMVTEVSSASMSSASMSEGATVSVSTDTSVEVE